VGEGVASRRRLQNSRVCAAPCGESLEICRPTGCFCPKLLNAQIIEISHSHNKSRGVKPSQNGTGGSRTQAHPPCKTRDALTALREEMPPRGTGGGGKGKGQQSGGGNPHAAPKGRFPSNKAKNNAGNGSQSIGGGGGGLAWALVP